ncbi:phage terminase large subunit family protein [Polycladidibacter hongkongensis]|uniref:phage terminase large subunit family protein n=1 Tax=Polycladidibacter hongkongensis TaxID=1647556 RepID=UPI00082C1FEB|nr:terminase gpA endonuclease subunit [Pseudovibrio hongkongensis]
MAQAGFELPPRAHGWRPPAYASAAGCLAEALPILAPVRRMSVSHWAGLERRLQDNGAIIAWDNKVTPYMVEPMDMSASRRFRGVVFAGPARTGKTDALILNRIGHAICCEPCDMRVIHMDRNAAREFSLKKVGALVNYTPALKQRLGRGRFDNNILDKRFQGGMTLDIGWPVVSKVSASDLPLMLLSDYDRAPEDVEGEGNLFDLALKRTETFGSRGMAIAESSPGRLIEDDDFLPPEGAPHMAPPATGILALYNRGTRGRYYWTCPDCRELFEPDYELLHFPDEGSPKERGLAAVMGCPHCGAILEPRHKLELNRAGRWLHESKTGELVSVEDATLRETELVSYWLKGAAAAFQSWASLVSRYESAWLEFQQTGDETALKTTVNVDQGKPYSSRMVEDEDDLSVKQLKAMAEPYLLKVAPPQTRFLTVAVDVQKGRFVVQVDAWGPGLERWLIDRFDVHTPPAAAPSADARAIDPAKYKEDWDALLPLLERYYPVAGNEYQLKPAALIVDSGGADGVTKNAYAFYRKSRRLSLRRRVFLAKGLDRWERDRAKEVTPEKEEGKRVKRRSDLRIVRVGTWRLKSEVTASLAREDPGADAYHLSRNLPDEVFEEFCAERRTPKGWVLRKGRKRNEALDLGVYGLALVLVLRAEKINWKRPPVWARSMETNSFAAPRPSLAEAPATGSRDLAGEGAGEREAGAAQPETRQRETRQRETQAEAQAVQTTVKPKRAPAKKVRRKARRRGNALVAGVRG